MEHNITPLISDLGLILIVAAIVTLIFRKLKQPLILGYIIAGFLVSPYSNIVPTVTDIKNIETLAEIGVIFILFSLGLEFSFKKLMRVGGVALIAAVVKIFVVIILGYICGKLLHWSTMNALFLGGMLASSSTTIIIRTFDDLGLKSKNYTKKVFGILVVEDIVIILLMVLLSTASIAQKVEGLDLILIILKLGFFLVLWFLLGIFIIPTFLKKIKYLLDDEGYLILSIGLCLSMVMIATKVGFSAELGAFLMGSILAETLAAEKITSVFKPIKDLFGAIFFVSVGMMINITMILEYKWIVLLVVFLVVFGKFIATMLGSLLSGQTLKESVSVSMSMSQVGEFAFIVATLGMSLGVIYDFLFPVAVGAFVITTFTTPYMIKYSDKAYNLIEKRLPEKYFNIINNYSKSSQVLETDSNWKHLLKSYLQIIIINGTIIIFIILLSSYFIIPFLKNNLNWNISEWISLLITLILSTPFIWALIYKRPDNMTISEILESQEYSSRQVKVLEIFRVIIGFVLLGYLINKFLPAKQAILIILPILIIITFIFSKYIQKFYSAIEGRFMYNLNEREKYSEDKNKVQTLKKRLSETASMSAWDVHMVDLTVPTNAIYIGKTISELNWRKRFQINVIYIRRGDNVLYLPKAETKIMPSDHIGIFGSDIIVEKFKKEFLKEVIDTNQNIDMENIIANKFYIKRNSPMINTSIKNSKIKENSQGIVVAIERGAERILTPPASLSFQEGDIVWIVGEKEKLEELVM